MINWREGKFGIAGSSKRTMVGVFTYSFSIPLAVIPSVPSVNDINLEGSFTFGDINLEGVFTFNDINLEG